MEPDGEVQFTPEDSLPQMRILTITVDPSDEDSPVVDCSEFELWEVKGLLLDTLDWVRGFELANDEDED